MKLRAKKKLIKDKADIEILSMDIIAKLHEDVINTKNINKLIDEKYDLKKQKTKSLIETYIELKNILTEDQREKLKTLCNKGSGLES